jgi:predicted dehydrogenase
MAKLRLGVIGAGSWAISSHLPNFAKRRDDVEFVAVCRKGDLLQKVKDDWGFEIASEDYRDVIGAGIDICLVASPHGLHYEHSKAALESGAHVLCEKPFTVEPAHAWELVEIADRKNLHLVLSYGWNYKTAMREAKQLMDERGIGEIEQSALQMASVCRELLANLGAYPQSAPEAVPEQATWTDPRNGCGSAGCEAKRCSRS